MSDILLRLVRVSYGLDSTPVADREYKLKYPRRYSDGSPVGTMAEWETFASEAGYEGLSLEEKNGSVTERLFDEPSSFPEGDCSGCAGSLRQRVIGDELCMTCVDCGFTKIAE